MTVTVVVLGLGAVLAGIFIGPVTAVIAPGFDAPQVELTGALTRIVLLATVFIAGTNMLAAMVQAHGKFAWSALEGVPFNLVMVAAAGLFGPRYGVTALAVGFVIGSAGRLAFQIPPVRALGARIRPSLDFGNRRFREVATLAPPMLVGTALTNVNTMVDRAVASTLGEGTITALSYGWRLVHLPETLVITSLLIPLYPAFGAAARNPRELRRLVGRGLSVTVTVLTPLCVVMAVAAPAVVDLAFGYGAFDAEQVSRTAVALAWYTPALLALGCRTVMVRASYAVGDSRSPVVVAVLAMIVNVVGDIALGPAMGIAGIALATTLSFVVAALGNGWLLYRRRRGLDLRATGTLVLRAGVLAGGCVVIAWLVVTATVGLPPVLGLSITVLAVGAAYLLGLSVLRAPERAVVLDAVRVLRRR